MDPDEKLYGKLLFEESDKNFKSRLREQIIITTSAIIIGICLLLSGLIVMASSDSKYKELIIGLVFAAFVPGIIFYIITKYWIKLRIYSSGLILGGTEKEFIKFSEIDHIWIFDIKNSDKKYFLINKKKTNQYYGPISEYQFHKEYYLILDFIKKQLKSIQNKVPYKYLIRIKT